MDDLLERLMAVPLVHFLYAGQLPDRALEVACGMLSTSCAWAATRADTTCASCNAAAERFGLLEQHVYRRQRGTDVA